MPQYLLHTWIDTLDHQGRSIPARAPEHPHTSYVRPPGLVTQLTISQALTDQLAAGAEKLIEEVEAMGGMAAAVASGMPKHRIEQSAARKQAKARWVTSGFTCTPSLVARCCEATACMRAHLVSSPLNLAYRNCIAI